MKSSVLPLVLVPWLAVLSGCSRAAGSAATVATLPPVGVHAVTAQFVDNPVITEVTGTVRTVQRATLAPKVMGTITEFPVALGQVVNSGDLLVKISAGEISARLAQAQAQLNVARRDLARERDLLAKGASTAEMVRNLEDRCALTAAMVHEAEVMLGYTEIRAPFDGVVTGKNADAGDLASPGHALLEIDGRGAFEVATGIPDSLAYALTVGTPVSLVVPATGLTVTGRLTELSSAADATARTVAARIALPADAVVRSGQFVRVQVPGPRAQALFVPSAAVSGFGQMERVFVVAGDQRAVLRLVKTGVVRGGSVEILAGLDPGERVVVAPPVGLHEGQALELQP